MNVQRMDSIDFELDGEDENTDLKMRLIGSTAVTGGLQQLKQSRVSHVEFTKGFVVYSSSSSFFAIFFLIITLF